MDIIDWSAVRSIPPKTKGNRGYFPTKKVPNGYVAYESQLERDFFLLCDHDPSVLKVQHQPVKISLKKGKQGASEYTPDVFIEFMNKKKVLAEIKEEIDQKTILKNKHKWNAAKRWAEKRGVIFSVITKAEIRTARMANIWFTLGSSKERINQKYQQTVLDILKTYGSSGILYEDLIDEVAQQLTLSQPLSAQIVCNMIYFGQIYVDSFSTEILSAKTRLKRKLDEGKPSIPSLFNIFLSEKDESSENINSEQIIESSVNKLDMVFSSENELEIVKAKEKIIKAWLKQPKHKKTHLWRQKFIKTWEKKNNDFKLSIPTIYRWVKKYEKFGLKGLVNNKSKSGRRRNFDPETKEILEATKKYYLKPLVSYKEAYEDYLLEKWKESFDPPSFWQFYYYVKSSSTKEERAFKKKGKKYHKTHFSPSYASFQGAIMPMQVLQIDNTKMDVFPVDNIHREVLATPNLTAAIDCYTGMITGIYLSYEEWSSQSVLETLVQSISNKEKYESTYKTEVDWRINGFPVLILVDNGMDYRSKELLRFCLDYDIILEFAPLRAPKYKAYIERWFKILNTALQREIKEGFRPSLKERRENPDLDPETSAIHTIQYLEKWLYLWIIEEYHIRNQYSDHLPAPILRLEDTIFNKTDVTLPATRSPPTYRLEQDILLLSTLNDLGEKTLTREGIQWEYLKYNNEEISKIYKETGKIKLRVLQDRRDIRTIWVVFKDKPVEVDLGSGWGVALVKTYENLPINASAWIKDVRSIPKALRRRITPYTYLRIRSKQKRRELLKTSKRETKFERKKREQTLDSERRLVKKRIQTKKKASLVQEPLHHKSTVKSKKPIDWSKIKPALKSPMARLKGD